MSNQTKHELLERIDRLQNTIANLQQRIASLESGATNNVSIHESHQIQKIKIDMCMSRIINLEYKLCSLSPQKPEIK